MSLDSERLSHVRFFTRADCSLCERAYPILERLAAEGLITVERLDIATDPALAEQYGARIPVVVFSTGMVYEGRISEARLRRHLAAGQPSDTP